MADMERMRPASHAAGRSATVRSSAVAVAPEVCKDANVVMARDGRNLG